MNEFEREEFLIFLRKEDYLFNNEIMMGKYIKIRIKKRAWMKPRPYNYDTRLEIYKN